MSRWSYDLLQSALDLSYALVSYLVSVAEIAGVESTLIVLLLLKVFNVA